MKLSKMHFKTLREVPKEAEIPSHILLLRSGMIKKTAAGIYSYMPFGWRTVRKIENIVREEMDELENPFRIDDIIPVTIEEAKLWGEKHLDPDDYIACFGEVEE